MGEDKSLLPFKNSTLIEYQYKKLSKIFKKVYISSKTNKFDFDCDIIYDNNSDISSPMIALNSIFKTLQEDKIFIITVDTPLILEETIYHLVELCDNYDITIAKDNERVHNLCGVFSKNINQIIDQLIEKDIHKINYLLKHIENLKIVSFQNNSEFINLNTKEQYNSILKNISL